MRGGHLTELTTCGSKKLRCSFALTTRVPTSIQREVRMQSESLVSHMTRRVICDSMKSQIRPAQLVAWSVLEQLIGIIIAVLM